NKTQHLHLTLYTDHLHHLSLTPQQCHSPSCHGIPCITESHNAERDKEKQRERERERERESVSEREQSTVSEEKVKGVTVTTTMPVDALSADTPQPLPGVKERAGMAHSTRAPSTAIAPAEPALQRL